MLSLDSKIFPLLRRIGIFVVVGFLSTPKTAILFYVCNYFQNKKIKYLFWKIGVQRICGQSKMAMVELNVGGGDVIKKKPIRTHHIIHFS